MKYLVLCIAVLYTFNSSADNECIYASNATITGLINVDNQCAAKTSNICEDISDNFCKAVWSKDVLGNFSLSNGDSFHMGATRNKLLSYAEILDFQALNDAACKLPKDLRKNLNVRCSGPFKNKGLIGKIIKHINKESKSKYIKNTDKLKEWSFKFSDLKRELSRRIWKTSTDRTYHRKPQLKNKRPLSIDDSREVNRDYYDLKNIILEAKYTNHPNWLRVKNVFQNVKKDLIEVTQSFNLEAPIKQQMISRINDVKLSLPYEDPRKFGASKNCSSTLVNAFYHPIYNLYIICAGYFNTMQSSASLYKVTAHEVAHSIDPKNRAFVAFMNSPIADFNRQVYNANGKISCDQWSSQMKSVYVEPKKPFTQPRSIENLSQCLIDRSQLKEFKLSKLKGPSTTKARNYMSHYATYETFSMLAIPHKITDGVEEANEYFLNPKRYKEAANNHFETHLKKSGLFDTLSTFIQNLNCINDNINSDSTTISDQAFDAALESTINMASIYNKIYMSYLTNEDSDLQQYKLSKPSGEAWSDWMAAKAIEIFLSRVNSPSQKRHLLLSAGVSRCNSGDLAKKTNLNEVEKAYSFEPHPLRRNRRLQLLTKNTASQVQCQQGTETREKNNACDSEIINSSSKSIELNSD